MAAYVVVDVNVTDPEAFRGYMALAERSLAECGGRYLVRGGAIEVLEGPWVPARVVVLEFEDLECARSWYDGESYRAARAAREGAAQLNMVLVPGYVAG